MLSVDVTRIFELFFEFLLGDWIFDEAGSPAEVVLLSDLDLAAEVKVSADAVFLVIRKGADVDIAV